MKKIFLVFIYFLSLCSYSQNEEYKNLFITIDSINQNKIASYIGKVVDLTKYEYSKANFDKKKIKTLEILYTLKLDDSGRLKLIFINDKNEDLKPFIENILTEIPAILIYDSEKILISDVYVTASYKLRQKVNLPDWEKNIFKQTTKDSVKTFKNIEAYPSFRDFKDTKNKEKALADFNSKIAKHIQKYFEYPNYALNNNIQGRVNIDFIIEKDGTIENVIAYNAHPVLQHKGIEIIKKMPKLNPGFYGNKPIRVIYGLPLNFKLK